MNEYLQTLDLALNYLRQTGMAKADFARKIGYAPSTLSIYLGGRYREITKAGSDSGSSEHRITESILRYLELNPIVAEEFGLHLYETDSLKAMRSAFGELAKRPCIFMIYAPPGSGKTDQAKSMISDINRGGEGLRAYRVYCRSKICPRDLMRRISVACGSIGEVHVERALTNLRHDFRGQRVVLYLDEAQHLSPDCFETIRELYDELGWSLCFAGSHDLDRIFIDFAGTLEQFERRVTERVYLPALSQEEADGIIRSELPNLDQSQVRALIDGSTVQIRAQKRTQRYISIGRVMSAIRSIQDACPESADAPSIKEVM